ncbi:MAG: WG repeat-containing protein [Acidobacteria bacterium]|nr:WG repeat-containing protein [Acidobacteriota bacterium]
MLYPISVPNEDSAEDLYGYIDSSGCVIVQPSYSYAGHFFEGVAVVAGTDGLCGLIDGQGVVALPCSFDGLGRSREGLLAAQQGSKSGFVDTRGHWRIRGAFQILGEFSEGLSAVSPDGLAFGYIDDTGRVALSPRFEQAGRFSNGLAATRKDEKWGYVDRRGRVAIDHQYDGPRASPLPTDWRACVCRAAGDSSQWTVNGRSCRSTTISAGSRRAWRLSVLERSGV